ncbi:LytTR family transcriptional regulator DNA-binding domain-containing protein [Lactobacillus delbrueckii]|nr:LytTR family transcriptional regulator DNA-binding domain-containing protein [Lactobacillus delbrueckii]MDA3778333.1 LytTR family transcriptional regulator DNA-binding domain-containing protein [Lactobacillus delbrueckii]
MFNLFLQLALAFLSTIFSKSKITLSMLLTKGQAEVPVFQIWNQPFKTLRVYDKNKVFDCLGTLKDYEKRYPNLVPADRQSLINLDAVQNYDKKRASPILIKALPIPSPAVCHVETECNKK